MGRLSHGYSLLNRCDGHARMDKYDGYVPYTLMCGGKRKGLLIEENSMTLPWQEFHDYGADVTQVPVKDWPKWPRLRKRKEHGQIDLRS